MHGNCASKRFDGEWLSNDKLGNIADGENEKKPIEKRTNSDGLESKKWTNGDLLESKKRTNGDLQKKYGDRNYRTNKNGISKSWTVVSTI